jgi:hypothetical protein
LFVHAPPPRSVGGARVPFVSSAGWQPVGTTGTSPTQPSPRKLSLCRGLRAGCSGCSAPTSEPRVSHHFWTAATARQRQPPEGGCLPERCPPEDPGLLSPSNSASHLPDCSIVRPDIIVGTQLFSAETDQGGRWLAARAAHQYGSTCLEPLCQLFERVKAGRVDCRHVAHAQDHYLAILPEVLPRIPKFLRGTEQNGPFLARSGGATS